MNMLLGSRIIPGCLHTDNRTACDWGWHGFFAYGCHNVVVVLDTRTIQVIQTVQEHTSPICQVKWMQEDFYHDEHTSYNLTLAAGNTAGYIMIWDIRNGTMRTEFSEPNRAPLSMEWLKGYDVSHDLLLVLYSPNILILWNADTGVSLWKKNFADSVISVTIDPFNCKHMTVMSSDWIMLIKDFSIAHAPSDKGRKFYMSSSATNNSSQSSAGGHSAPLNKSTPSKSTFQKVKSWAGDLRGRDNDGVETPCECLQVTYLPANKNNVLLLFPREILILDMEIGHAVGSFSIEPSSPSFSMVFPCSQRDILYLLHENGSISMRAVRSPDRLPYQYDYDEPEKILSSRISLDVLYEIKCHSDVFRLSRTSRLMGFCVDPVSECNTAVLLADGRILFWSLTVAGGETYHFDSLEGLPNLQQPEKIINDASLYSLDRIMPPLLSFGEDKYKHKHKKARFLLNGLFEGISQSPVCAKMCPPMTTKNFKSYEALVAVACSNGVLQIFNACTGILKKLFSLGVHNLNGLEWVTLTTLLVYCNGGAQTSKSEIMHVDVISGVVKTLPSSRGLKESAVASLKVSHQKQYFLVLFKKHGAELWDAVNLCQLREFPTNFPKMTAFEWSPSSYGSRVGRKKANSSMIASSANLDESGSNMLDGKVDETKKVARSKEHLVFTDIDGTVFHYVVEGISLKDGTKVPPETGMGLISYITWKGDMLVLGDVDGNMNFWDLKAKVSRVSPTHRGIVKRIKFAPGKGNMKMIVLFNDGIEVWDASEEKSLLSIKSSKDQVLDADWFSSSFPLLLFADGSIRIYNTSLKTTNSPISDKELDEKIFNPRLLDVSSAMKLKHILQHQPWRDKYDAEEFSHDRSERLIQDQLDVIPRDVLGLLYNCPFGTAERCVYVAQIYGDESDYRFWKVALHYLKSEKVKKTCPHHQSKGKEKDSKQVTPRSISPSNSYDDFLLPSDEEDSDDSGLSLQPCTCLKSSLDTNFDILCDNQFYKKLQVYNVALCDSHRASYEHTRQCAEKLILLGEMDRAVQILLEGEPADTSYYTDALRACLIATVKSSGASQSTIKLVATNLIASGKLTEGVELLCLVDKGTDACRYLQTYGNWELATWLAKVRLNSHDSCDVITRWCDHLCTSNKKAEAILILLSLGKFTKVLELMFGLGQTDRAVLFLEACLEFGALSLNDEVKQILFENIFLDYARLQIKLDHRAAFEYYCLKAGGRGRKLLEEHRPVSSPTTTNSTVTNTTTSNTSIGDLPSSPTSMNSASSPTTAIA